MNEGDIRIRGLEAIRNWMSKDERYISMIGECEIIRDAVSILRRRTIGEGEEEEEGREGEEEEGVSVREKNGISGIVLEMVEGGGWRGKYEEVEEVVGRLEEEGEKEWRERKGKRGGRGGGMEWREMGRLAHEVGWEIEKRKGRGGDGEMIMSLRGMKKNLEEEKKKVAEKDKQLEEERRRAYEEKRAFEERISRMEKEMEEMKKKRSSPTQTPSNTPPSTPIASNVITSLDGTSVVFAPSNDYIKREGNTIIHHGPNSFRHCFIGGEMRSV